MIKFIVIILLLTYTTQPVSQFFEIRSTNQLDLLCHQDAHELLTELLDRIHEEMKAVMKLQPSLEQETEDDAALENSIPPVPSTPTPDLPSPVDSNFKWFYKESSCCKV